MRCWIMLACAALLAAQPPERVAGLRAPAEILYDRWGIPHIYAANLHDAYFLQGWNAAHDRLWQMDTWRKLRLGLMHEDLGPAFVPQDRAARLFLYRGDMEAEWRAYTPDLRDVLEAFTAGVSAWVAHVRAHPELLPWEFQQLGYLPSPWRAEDLLRIRAAALSSNAAQEVARSRQVCATDLETTLRWSPLSLPWKTAVPAGFDPCSVPADVLNVLTLAKTPPVMRKELADPPQRESNNWAIAPARSATGRAILATDPHRAHTLPAFRYFAHIAAPGLDIIGFGEPVHPGLVFGHNARVAWGQTTFNVDMEDLYVYETNPGALAEYRYRGRWEAVTVVRETLHPKGSGPVGIEMKFTRHGPVIYEDLEHRRAFALRAAWLRTGGATFLATIGLNRARNWSEFTAELERYRVPGNNVVYADVEGNIGIADTGSSPSRPNWDGVFPVPGDGRYEWGAYRRVAELPREYNPARGFVFSANAAIYGADSPWARMKLGFDHAEPWRHERIRAVLGAPGKISFQAAAALQNDYRDGLAAALLPFVRRLAPSSPAQRMLAAWDGTMAADSGAAALHAVWYRTLARRMVQGVHGHPIPKSSAVVAQLRNPKHDWSAILNESLAAAYTETVKLLGPNPAQWRWGQLHKIALDHPLSPLVDEARRATINIGPGLSKGGSGNTVGAMAYGGAGFNVAHGASSRLVMDVGAWDNSLFLHLPGQSGDPASPHYRDLFESWAREQYQPLLYTRAAVEKAAVRRLKLTP
jgi:penicillin amidase